jgi:23S rRNA G2445 N2-methylase RlmL
MLTSIPSIQSITQKAIIKKISNSDSELLQIDVNKADFEIFIFLQDNLCKVFLNTS